MSSDGQCLQCSDTYNVQNGLCVEKKESELFGCSFFKGTSKCQSCNKGIFFNDVLCAAVYQSIPYCIRYNGSMKCIQCEKSFLLSNDQLSCKQSEAAANCKVSRNYFCTECQPGFILNKSSYAYTLESPSAAETDRFLLNQHRISNFERVLQVDCVSSSVQNCKVLKSKNKCSKCESGFALSAEGLCFVPSTHGVLHCAVYNRFSDCVECQPGHFLFQNELCAEVEPIPDCKLYDTKAGTSLCKRCSESKFLSAAECTDRTVAVENCALMAADAEACEGCKPKFVLGSDALQCFPEIEHCVLYSSADVATCAECRPGFKLEAEKCSKISLANCLVQAADACSACERNFYAENGVCLENTNAIVL